MRKLSLDALARELLSRATEGEASGATSGSRAAQTVVGGHEKVLRQTVIALAKDAALAEHASPGEATLYVLRGRVYPVRGNRVLGGTRRRPARHPGGAAQPHRPGGLRRPADSSKGVVAHCNERQVGVGYHVTG